MAKFKEIVISNTGFAIGPVPGATSAATTIINSAGQVAATGVVTATGITAHAGGGQSLAVTLTAPVSEITTVATAGDSVALPASAVGLQFRVINAGANSLQIYGNGTETINSVAHGTGIPMLPGEDLIFVCFVAGNWISRTAATLASATITTATITTPVIVKGTATESGGAVTLNTAAGVVTSQSLTTAAGSSHTMTLTNSKIATTSVVLATVNLGTATTGTPLITAVTPGSGSVSIVITNINASAALNGTLLVQFLVV